MLCPESPIALVGLIEQPLTAGMAWPETLCAALRQSWRGGPGLATWLAVSWNLCKLNHFIPKDLFFWILWHSQVCPPCILVDNHFRRVQALLVASIDPVNPPVLAQRVWVTYVRERFAVQGRCQAGRDSLHCSWHYWCLYKMTQKGDKRRRSDFVPPPRPRKMGACVNAKDKWPLSSLL